MDSGPERVGGMLLRAVTAGDDDYDDDYGENDFFNQYVKPQQHLSTLGSAH